jgi:hypothetical protein
MTTRANMDSSSTDASGEQSRTVASCYSRDKVGIVRRRTVSESTPRDLFLSDDVPRPVSVAECRSAGPPTSRKVSRFSIQVLRQNGEADLPAPSPPLPPPASPTKVGKFSIVRVPRPRAIDPDLDLDLLFGVRSAPPAQHLVPSGFDPLIDIF